MLNMKILEEELIASKPIFKAVSPTVPSLLTGTAAKVANYSFKTIGFYNLWRAHRDHKPTSKIVGTYIGSRMIGKIAVRPIKTQVIIGHRHMANLSHKDIWRKNGMGGRSWITTPGQHEMVIVFHDANRAGPHVDLHLGRLSMIMRVKPDVYSQLRYNRDGILTEDSRQILLNFVRAEIGNSSRVPQNLDHSLTNARANWTFGDVEGKNYGDGYTRQIISVSKIDVYKAHDISRGPNGVETAPIEFYAPVLNPHRSMYLYRLQEPDGKRAPICIWGNKVSHPPALDDRLHLKMVHPDHLENMHDVLDMETSTAKLDGSSSYFVIGPKSTTVWSPRTSVRTGEQIEYTFKTGTLPQLTNKDLPGELKGQTVVGMGEIVFHEKNWKFWEPDVQLACATGSGILNSNQVLPDNIQPEIHLYRIDKVGRTSVVDEDFWTNRAIQEQVASAHPNLKVVELMSPTEAHLKGYEGVVAIPFGQSVNDGYKVKWKLDAEDWVIKSVDFYPGERGGVAGVVWATNTENGRDYKLGPSQVGDQTLTRSMMSSPDNYVGTVLKVESNRGHSGRAAKVIAIGLHDDKGLAAF